MTQKPFVRKAHLSNHWYIQMGPGPYIMSDNYTTQQGAFRAAERMMKWRNH